MKMTRKGFTLIELMIVVAIIGILAAIAIPKFADLINKSKEGATKGSLSSIRSSLQVYYGDNEGWFPYRGATAGTALNCLTDNSKYLSAMPVTKLPGTGVADNAAVREQVASNDLAAQAMTATGGWYYYNDASVNTTWGNLSVNAAALVDLKDTSWTSY